MTVANGSSVADVDDRRSAAGDLAHDVAIDVAGDVDDHRTAFGCGSPLADDDRNGAQQPIDRVRRRRATVPCPGLSTARRMSCSWIQQSSTRMCKKSAIVPGPVGVAISFAKYSSSAARSVASRRSTSAFHSASTSAPEEPRRASTSASLNWPIGFFTCSPTLRRRLGSRQALQHPFRADQVREVVLHRPTGEVGGQLPLAFVELVAERRRPIARSPRVCRWSRSGIMASSRCGVLDRRPLASGQVRLELAWRSFAGRRWSSVSSARTARRTRSTCCTGPTASAPRRRSEPARRRGRRWRVPLANTMIGTPNAPYVADGVIMVGVDVVVCCQVGDCVVPRRRRRADRVEQLERDHRGRRSGGRRHAAPGHTPRTIGRTGPCRCAAARRRRASASIRRPAAAPTGAACPRVG